MMDIFVACFHLARKNKFYPQLIISMMSPYRKKLSAEYLKPIPKKEMQALNAYLDSFVLLLHVLLLFLDTRAVFIIIMPIHAI